MPEIIQPHPELDRLRAFSLGRLEDDAASAEIAGHIETCVECRAKLETVAADTIEGLVRNADTSHNDVLATAGISPTPSPAEIPLPLRDHPRYEIIGRLGEGGMGAVFHARHKLMDREVALKVIHPRLLERAAAVERFRREVKAAARLSHPNIVTAFDAEQAGDLHLLVMEYVAGESLDQLVRRRGALPIDEACEYIRQAALGLDHAHQRGMVHRDIKPANLMFAATQARSASEGSSASTQARSASEGSSASTQARSASEGPFAGASGLPSLNPDPQTMTPSLKILDFGLARVASELGSSSGLSQDGAVMGTPDFLAPEQAEDSHTADIRADIYSLGCTLYFLLTGQSPFPTGTIMQKLRAHMTQTPRPVSELRPDVPPPVIELLDKMLAKNPADRFQTPAELAAAITAVAVGWAESSSPTIPEAKISDSNLVGLEDSAHPTPAPLEQLDGTATISLHNAPNKSGDKSPHSKVRLAVLAAAVLFALGGVVYRISTDRGELVINCHDDAVEVTITRNGQPVVEGLKVSHGQAKTTVRSGDIEVLIRGDRADDFTVTSDQGGPPKFVLSRDGKAVVEITRLEKTGKPVAVIDPDKQKSDLAKGQVTPVRPVEIKSEPLPPIQGGEPLSPLALVQKPAEIKGVRSWTIETIKSRGWLNSIAYSPDGKNVATLGQDGNVRLLDAVTGRLVRVFVGTGELVQGNLAWQPNSRNFATIDGLIVRLWDADSGKVLRVISFGADGAAANLAWSPDGQWLAVGIAAHSTSRVAILDPTKGKIAQEIANKDSFPYHLAWSPDSKLLALGTPGPSYLPVYDITSGKLVKKLEHGGHATENITWSPDGKRVYALGFSGGAPWYQCWEFESGRSLGKDKDLDLTRDGKKVVIGNWAFHLLTAPGKPACFQPLQSHNTYPFSVSPDGKTFAVANVLGGTISFNDTATGELVKSVERIPHYGNPHSSHVLWSRDGTAIGTIGPGPQYALERYWDTTKAQRIVGEKSRPESPWYSPDGKWLVKNSGGSRTNDVVDVSTGKILFVLDTGSWRGADESGAWSADSQRFAFAANNGAQIWDIKTGKRLHLLSVEKEGYGTVSFSPDGKLLAAGGGGKVRVWDTISGDLTDTFPGPSAEGSWLLWSADGKTLTSSADDGMRDWDIATGRMIRRRPWRMGTPSPDRRFGADRHVNTTRVWDLETGQRRLTMMLLPDERYVSFSPDGHYAGSPRIERDLVYIVETDDGVQHTLTPEEFATKYGWKNNPDRVRLAGPTAN